MTPATVAFRFFPNSTVHYATCRVVFCFACTIQDGAAILGSGTLYHTTVGHLGHFGVDTDAWLHHIYANDIPQHDC